MGAGIELSARMFLIGLAVAAPVGAMAVLCIQRVIGHGWAAGMATGAGIATADGIYAAAAAFGVTAVSVWMVDAQAPLRLAGGLLLAWLGWRALRSEPALAPAPAADSPRLVGMYGSAVGLTLTNPLTMVAFAAVFASAGLTVQPGAPSAALAILGVTMGSLTWWTVLSTGVWTIRHMLSDSAMLWINRIAGGVLIGLGVIAAVTGIAGLGWYS